MRVVVLAREGRPARWLASALAEQHDLRVIFERGTHARRRKLSRYFKTTPAWTWPWQIVNIVAALWYNRRLGRAVDQFCAGKFKASVQYSSVVCEDANDHVAHAHLREWRPDLVLVYGTALLNAATLKLAPSFINLHGGLVPRYRNVHCEFWALANDEPSFLGTSALHVDAGVDTGDVFLQRALPPTSRSTVRDAVCANHQLAVDVALDVVRLVMAGEASRSPQDPGALRRATRTPGAIDLLRALMLGKPRLW